MKKFTTILTIIFVTMFAVSCATARQANNTNTIYEAEGVGTANDEDIAWMMAFDKAKAKIMEKYQSQVVTESTTRYAQTKSGYHGSDHSTTTVTIRSMSDGALYDIVVAREKKLPWWKRGGFLYGYKVSVKVNPSNIKSYID